MTNAHLIKLSGMGDTQWVLIDDAANAYLETCCKWQKGNDIPKVPELLIDRIVEEDGIDRGDAAGYLTLDPRSSSWVNDMVLSMPASVFNGEKFFDFEGSVSKLNAFVTRHGLTLHETYDGYIY